MRLEPKRRNFTLFFLELYSRFLKLLQASYLHLQPLWNERNLLDTGTLCANWVLFRAALAAVTLAVFNFRG